MRGKRRFNFDLTEWIMGCFVLLCAVAIVVMVGFIIYDGYIHSVSDTEITEHAPIILDQEMNSSTTYVKSGNTLIPVTNTKYVLYLDNGVTLEVNKHNYSYYNVGMRFPILQIDYLDADGNVWDTRYKENGRY